MGLQSQGFIPSQPRCGGREGEVYNKTTKRQVVAAGLSLTSGRLRCHLRVDLFLQLLGALLARRDLVS